MIVAIGLLSGLLGCSEEGSAGGEPDAGGASGASGASGAGGSSGSGGSGGSDGTLIFGEDGGTTESCAATFVESDPLPLDIYVMFDQSGSMFTEDDEGVHRIDAVRDALEDFLAASGDQDLGMGIGYFGYQEIGETTCDPADYETPAVSIAELPENEAAIRDSLAATNPIGETPTGAAIRGACRYTEEWKGTHPDRAVVNLLVTDGEPKTPVTESCEPTLEDAEMAASDCANSAPEIPTYVLGVGPSLDNLDRIALAGGTDGAHLVSESSDVSARVLAALNRIRGDATGLCDLQVPEPSGGQELDLNAVNVVFTPEGGGREVIPYVETSSGCDAQEGGWHYDVPPNNLAAAQRIELCDLSCGDVTGRDGRLDIALGCQIEVLE